jgi:hypothetical protein
MSVLRGNPEDICSNDDERLGAGAAGHIVVEQLARRRWLVSHPTEHGRNIAIDAA